VEVNLESFFLGMAFCLSVEKEREELENEEYYRLQFGPDWRAILDERSEELLDIIYAIDPLDSPLRAGHEGGS